MRKRYTFERMEDVGTIHMRRMSHLVYFYFPIINLLLTSHLNLSPNDLARILDALNRVVKLKDFCQSAATICTK